MTDPQKESLRQNAANLSAAIQSIVPTGARNASVTLDYIAGQVNVQIQSTDSSLPSGTAVEVQTLACKMTDLPAAQ